jgi:hypothetical protein
MYHFKVAKSLTGSYTYFTQDSGSRQYYQSSSTESSYNWWPKRQSDVCIPCDYRCRRCTDKYHYRCSDCTKGSYLWKTANQSTICDYFCPTGNYSLPGNPLLPGNPGEYYTASTSRVCNLCNSYCTFCLTSADNCYMCVKNKFLVDNKEDCKTRYLTPTRTNCKRCESIATNNST